MRVLTTYKLKRLQNKVTVLQQLTQAFANEDEIKDFCKASVDIFVKEVLQSTDNLMITQSWANKNPKGSIHH